MQKYLLRWLLSNLHSTSWRKTMGCTTAMRAIEEKKKKELTQRHEGARTQREVKEKTA
jgi:hypothetical protein